jgi:hypothetical protein
MFAAEQGRQEVVRVLLEWGADKKIRMKASGCVFMNVYQAVPLHRYYR